MQPLLRGFFKNKTAIAVFSSAILPFFSMAQNSTEQTINSSNVVLLLFALVMVLAIFLAALLGDKIIKLTATREIGSNRASEVGLLPNKSEIMPEEVDKVAGKGNKVIRLKKGFDIKLKGKAIKEFRAFAPTTYAVKPADFPCMQPIPKMLVKVGDEVKAGDPLFHDRKMDNFYFTAPVSGEIVEINRGAKRAITEVVILADKEVKYKKFNANASSREEIVKVLAESGSMPLFTERPYGIPANPESTPKSIHISTFDTSPLAVDYNFVFNKVNEADFQAGLDILNKVAPNVHLNINAKKQPHRIFKEAKNVIKNWFEGAHPAGNVGIQIHHADPIAKGEVVWTIKPEDVVTIGKLFTQGKFDPIRYVAVGGHSLKEQFYVETRIGANVSTLINNNLEIENSRVISGNVLTGTAIEKDGFLGFKDNTISVIEEGDFYEMFGWILPQYARPSISPTIPWSLTPYVTFEANTNTHGEPRAFVVSGQYEQVLPMDVYPMQLFKSILYKDFEEMEGLGIYELLEEDIALCEFVCTSKQPLQAILRDGLDYIRSQS